MDKQSYRKEGMMDWIIEFKDELIVIGTAMLPVIELKGAIPVGVGLGMDIWKAFWLSYIGSMIPVPFLLLFLKPVIDLFKQIKWLKPIAHWIEDKCNTKSTRVRNYSLLGLFTFVGIPLPGTGVWTGSGISVVLDLRIKDAFPVIAIGNLLAGIIVMVITYGAFSVIG